MRRPRAVLLLAAALMAVALVAATPVRAQEELSTQQLVDRAGAYVLRFVADFANVVAEEEMRQEYRGGSKRMLKSDFLLVKYPGEDRLFLSFRDVFEVNGRPVRDQQDRLTKLFMQPFDDAVRRAAEISRDASRHSLVDLGPETSPLVVLAMLQPIYHQDYIYRLRGREVDDGVVMRVLDIEARPPVQRNPAIPIIRVEAKAWVEETTGRVRKTEMRIGRAPNTRMAWMTFRFDEGLGIDVPAEMKESRATLMELKATYTRFRRFQVRTEEQIDPDTASGSNN